MTFNDRIQTLRDKWERLSQRERTMVGAMGVTFVLMVTLIVGGSFPADPLDPHRGILLAMGLSTPS